MSSSSFKNKVVKIVQMDYCPSSCATKWDLMKSFKSQPDRATAGQTLGLTCNWIQCFK